jgi:predicted RNA-binding protein YlqC (UPF0109 family)
MNSFQSPVAKILLPIMLGACGHTNPNEFRVSEKIGETIDKLTVTPHMSDLPILIGTGGRQARAFKLLAETAGRKLGKKTEIYLEESYDGQRKEYSQKQRKEFDMDEFMRLLSGLAGACFKTIPVIDINHLDGRLFVVYDLGRNPDDDHLNIVTAMNDIFYPWGIRHNERITIKPKGQDHHAGHARYSVGAR